MKLTSLLLGILFCVGSTFAAESKLPSLAETKLAAEHGDAVAQNKLGDAYASRGDFAGALPWYHKAADQGLADAQCNYADLLMRDISLTIDGKAAVRHENPVEASKWFYKAAMQSHAKAQFRLACFYRDGEVAKQ